MTNEQLGWTYYTFGIILFNIGGWLLVGHTVGAALMAGGMEAIIFGFVRWKIHD